METDIQDLLWQADATEAQEYIKGISVVVDIGALQVCRQLVDRAG